MSDPKYGEPVEEPTPATDSASPDDAVARANDSLAEAEAASRDAVRADEQAAAARADAERAETSVSDSRDTSITDASSAERAADTGSPAASDSNASPDTAAAEPPMSDADWNAAYDSSGGEPAGDAAAADRAAAEPAVVATSATRDEPITRSEPETTAYATPAASSEPVASDHTGAGAAAGATGATAAYAGPQPIFVQAPEAPRPRGNRAAAGAIGLLAALSFALLYFAAALGLAAVNGEVDTASIGTWSLEALASWWFWVPVAVFFLGFWVLGAIVNRGRWGYWVIFGLFVGVAAYAGHLLGQLMQAPFWQLTASEGADLVGEQSLAPLAIAAFIFGRELTIWFGAWVAARGKRVTEINYEAQREYERTLEAGPQLHQM